ncbi:hypothetical protein EO95_15100 [Methanosarcina sp. 1.H.T.1A.1]|jgi:uncharacterized membrane protein YqhA|uniref:YqhA family protein n=1 Tax=Methanosarcina sp. 1.H.T.1A.1 TaxID=1483602 RepID=UPI000622A5CD|nr:YqhA family protein [Methanosarcina sp. 1.H.T.1A.1]KKI00005.1 hypothetical protein EO95_15100 [Methanosarcina sp. 1.H.T.1A.1]
MKVVRFIAGMRYFVLIPVIGLAITAGILFIKGGIDLLDFLYEMIAGIGEMDTKSTIIIELVEIVHLFLVGTVLFITSFGLYQLFIQPLPLPAWLEINDIEELELNLVGLTAVVLAVNFLSVVLEQHEDNLALYGIGYALPIAALSYFIKVRSKTIDNGKENLPASSEINSQVSEANRVLYKKGNEAGIPKYPFKEEKTGKKEK